MLLVQDSQGQIHYYNRAIRRLRLRALASVGPILKNETPFEDTFKLALANMENNGMLK
jgi:hypothetical protein